MQHAKPILIIILTFILIQICFSFIYYLIYKNNSDNFLFNNEIKISQDLEYIKDIKADITENNKLIDFYKNSMNLNETRKNLIQEFTKHTEKMLSQGYDFKNFFEKGFPLTINDHIFVIANINEKSRNARIYNKYFMIYTEDNKIIYEYNMSDFIKYSLARQNLDLSRLNKNLIKSTSDSIEYIQNKQNYLYEKLNELEEEKKSPYSFGILDFLYFGLTFVSHSDILPNSTLIRTLVIFQRIIELFLLVFAITVVSSIINDKNKINNS